MVLPDPPVNVVALYPDQGEIPVDTVYRGVSDRGVYQWEVVNAPRTSEIIGLRIDRLPPRTSITIGLETDA